MTALTRMTHLRCALRGDKVSMFVRKHPCCCALVHWVERRSPLNFVASELAAISQRVGDGLVNGVVVLPSSGQGSHHQHFILAKALTWLNIVFIQGKPAEYT